MTKPYLRTAPGKIKLIRQQLENGAKPSTVYEKAVEEAGGQFKSYTQSEEPRDLRQVSCSFYKAQLP